MHFIVVTGEFSTDYFEEFSIGLDIFHRSLHSLNEGVPFVGKFLASLEELFHLHLRVRGTVTFSGGRRNLIDCDIIQSTYGHQHGENIG